MWLGRALSKIIQERSTAMCSFLISTLGEDTLFIECSSEHIHVYFMAHLE